MAVREKQLTEQQAKLEKAQNEVDKQVAQKIAIERSKLTAAAMEEAKATLGLELQEVRILLEDRQKKLREAQQAELGLRKRQSELESRSEALELEVTRKLDEERGKIRTAAQQAAAEAEALKMAEKDKLIYEMQRQITTLKHKVDQGSQQLQGEVLELDVEAVGSAFCQIWRSCRPILLGRSCKNCVSSTCNAPRWEQRPPHRP